MITADTASDTVSVPAREKGMAMVGPRSAGAGGQFRPDYSRTAKEAATDRAWTAPDQGGGRARSVPASSISTLLSGDRPNCYGVERVVPRAARPRRLPPTGRRTVALVNRHAVDRFQDDSRPRPKGTIPEGVTMKLKPRKPVAKGSTTTGFQARRTPSVGQPRLPGRTSRCGCRTPTRGGCSRSESRECLPPVVRTPTPASNARHRPDPRAEALAGLIDSEVAPCHCLV